MNKTALIIFSVAVVITIAIIFSLRSNNSVGNPSVGAVENTEIRDGVQYVTINAKGGYSPRVSNAKAGIPTKLIVKTNGTYDCSAALVIRSLNFQKILAQSGEEVIDVGVPVAGKPLQGVCGMGMYSFLINFI
ncbi:MAG: cupredoxin domain-containing protein [Patescibacteria group bacterium]